MLTQIIGVSPSLRYFSENDAVRGCMVRMVNHPDDRRALLERLKRSLLRLSHASVNQRVLEKTPGHSLVADALAEYFTDARFIHIIRDGRDCALSMQDHPWIRYELDGRRPFWFSHVPQPFRDRWDEFGAWRRGVVRWAVYAAAARGAFNVDARRYLELTYADLCRAPQLTIDRVLSFLTLDKTPSVERQLAAVDGGSLGRWQSAVLSDADLGFYENVVYHFNLADAACET